MPKYKLKRESSGDRKNKKAGGIKDDYESQKSSGQQKLEQQSGGGDSGTSSTGSDHSTGGVESLYQSGVNEFVFNGKDLKNVKFSESYDLTIYESIDQLYRYGEMIIVDTEGLIEFTSLTNTWEEEHLEITLKNKFEGDNGRAFKFGLHCMTEEPLDDSYNIEKRNKKIRFKLYEEPFFTNFHKQIWGDSYKENTAPQIIASVMAKKVKTEHIKFVEGEKDPKLPIFINPNWSAKKLVKYMQNYGDKGPIKVFNVSKGEDTITIIAPLNKIIDGKIYPHTFKMVPSIGEQMSGAYKLGPYRLFGPNETHAMNSLIGETVVVFDYFFGKDKPKELEDYSQKDKEKYKWDEGNEEYKLEKRSTASVLCGKFKEGLKKAKHLGQKLLYKKDTKSKDGQKHGYVLDVESKPLVEAKLFNRFNESYVNSGMMLYTIIPGNKEVNVGQIWDIELPSSYQPKDSNNKNEPVSGKWLLIKITHRVRSSGSEGRVMYEMHCYFIRTGLEKSNRKSADSAS